MTVPDHDALLAELANRLRGAADLDEAAARAVSLLHERLPGWDWVGVYWLRDGALRLGPFVGEPTEHVVIPVGRGVCGAAVADDENKRVADVNALDNYLSCSASVRSELVVLIRDETGRALGQFDVDSHAPDRFSLADERLLERAAALLIAALRG